MKFIDEAVITVQSGDGGSGCVSFRREKYVPRGGPDGGDGGRGGHVTFRVRPGMNTLYRYRNQKIFRAGRGGYGQGKQKTGRHGSDLILEVPPGTIIYDRDSGEKLKDLSPPENEYLIARGGRGGQGNKRFTTSTNRAPRFAQPGEPGQTRNLILELKLLADIGLIGLPNAGKSTLISVISAARPKIANYPFTTLTPNLGVIDPGWGEPFIVADIPGLIEGAHEGTGLGIRFLKHVERTRLLVHIIDAAAIDPEAPLAGFEAINQELGAYKETLRRKKQIIVLNKMDLPEAMGHADVFTEALGGRDVFRISAASGEGVRELVNHLGTIVSQDRAQQDEGYQDGVTQDDVQ